MPTPIKILLIDEHQEDRNALSRCLAGLGKSYRLFEASSGETGLKWFRILRPDCVVMDLQLTDMVGMEALALLPAESHARPLKIFVWTGLADMMIQKGAASLPITSYAVKTRGSDERLAQAILKAFPGAAGNASSVVPPESRSRRAP